MFFCTKVFVFCLYFYVVTASPYADPISLAITKLLQRDQELGLSNLDSQTIVNRQQKFFEDFQKYESTVDQTQRHNYEKDTTSLGNPKVQIKNGIVVGTTLQEAHAFYSIPFGKEPKRFMPPEPVDDFTDEFNATTPDGKMCYQVRSDMDQYRPMMSEDCLVLNVHVPTTVDLSNSTAPPNNTLPVLVYFYGGFFYEGRATTSKLDGRWLSEAANAVVVTVNYRVGQLGFLIFEENGKLIEGNQGLKDQQLALRWVQDNIQKFSGDKNRVTIFGNSAGSQSNHFHLVSPVSKNLFNRAILQSSPTVFPYQNATEALEITDRVTKALNCRRLDPVAKCLRDADAWNITATRNEVIIRSLVSGDFYSGIEPFRPYIDGVEFTDQPLNLVQMGKWHNDKEVIIGTNNEEMSYVSDVLKVANIDLNLDQFNRINKLILGNETGTQIANFYADKYSSTLNYTDILGQQVTDMFFVCPNRALARFASSTSCNTKHGHIPVYLYNDVYALNEASCQEVESFTPVCGTAFHSSEIIFVFKSDEGYGTNFSDTDALVSDMFSTYWGGFANTGVPSSGLTTSLGEFTEWPSYAASSNWTNIRIKANQTITETSYRQEFCDLWDEVDYYVKRQADSTTQPQQTSTQQTSTQQTSMETFQPTTVGSNNPETTSGTKPVHCCVHFTFLAILSIWLCLFCHHFC